MTHHSAFFGDAFEKAEKVTAEEMLSAMIAAGMSRQEAEKQRNLSLHFDSVVKVGDRFLMIREK